MEKTTEHFRTVKVLTGSISIVAAFNYFMLNAKERYLLAAVATALDDLDAYNKKKESAENE